MYYLENLVSTIDAILDSKKKRHIVGGMLLSVSLFFCGLTFTVATMDGREGEVVEDEY